MTGLVPGETIAESHTYTAAGTYTVTVTIADNYGAASMHSFTVGVAAL